jgi:LacI family transcriptional regulator
MVTLRQVADKARVSVKTVSRVVNREAAVAQETRDAVMRVVDDLGYVPNAAARSMRTATSNVIGLLTDVIVTTPYAFDIIGGAEAVLREDGRIMLIGNTGGVAEREAEYWRMFRGFKAAGAVYATMFHHAVNLDDREFGSPVVLVNCFQEGRKRASVLPDDLRGGETQAAHLIAMGHRRIGCVSLNPIIPAAKLRLEGIRATLRSAGLSLRDELVRPGVQGPLGAEQLVAYEAARAILMRKDRPTAMICGHDQMALQVLTAALELGLRIPEDLSIIGFDDQRLITEALRPGLTTVALPHLELGRTGSRLLLRVLDGDAAIDERILVACPLIERGSCAPPADGGN